MATIKCSRCGREWAEVCIFPSSLCPVCRGDTQFDYRIAMCTQYKLFTIVPPEVTTTTCRCSAHDSFSKGLTIASIVAKFPKLMISLTQKGKDLLGFDDDGNPILKNTCRGCKFFTQPQSRVGTGCSYPYDGGLCGPNRHFWEEPDIIDEDYGNFMWDGKPMTKLGEIASEFYAIIRKRNAHSAGAFTRCYVTSVRGNKELVKSNLEYLISDLPTHEDRKWAEDAFLKEIS